MTTLDESPELRARVRSLSWESDDVVSVEFEGLDAPLPSWSPGAHIDLVVAGAPVRQYSLCGDPASPRYRIAVLREARSRGGSKAVHERLRPGDVVGIRGPRNHFALEDAPEYLFIAGGIGITPILPMLRAVSASGARWRALYLGASTTRMALLHEVASIDAAGGTVVVHPRDELGRADLAAEIPRHPSALVYACGPEGMLSAVMAVLPVESGRLRVEYFSAPVIEYEAGGPFAVRLARTGVEVTVEPDQSILEVMRAAGVEVLSDCEEGICGSCETHVIEGEIEHRDFVLTPQEKAANDCMMVCVSRAACPLLVLDA
jgi:ferredoxin-NADP reductase